MSENQPKSSINLQILEAGGVQIKKEEFYALSVEEREEIVKEAWAMTTGMSPED